MGPVSLPPGRDLGPCVAPSALRTRTISACSAVGTAAPTAASWLTGLCCAVAPLSRQAAPAKPRPAAAAGVASGGGPPLRFPVPQWHFDVALMPIEAGCTRFPARSPRPQAEVAWVATCLQFPVKDFISKSAIARNAHRWARRGQPTAQHVAQRSPGFPWPQKREINALQAKNKARTAQSEAPGPLTLRALRGLHRISRHSQNERRQPI